MSQNDRVYLERRRQLSEQKAREANDPAIARVHSQFAANYAAALSSASQQSSEN